jgi:hypothetical protein
VLQSVWHFVFPDLADQLQAAFDHAGRPVELVGDFAIGAAGQLLADDLATVVIGQQIEQMERS